MNERRRNLAILYEKFQPPITKLDCGEKCAPYNQNGVPFCCDLRHAVPAVYHDEWEYLVNHTDLWHLWEPEEEQDRNSILKGVPENQYLVACLGHTHCRREYRALTCRAFPFFPYIDRSGEFLGLSYYWEYEDRCWVISNLDTVEETYLRAFIRAFEIIFDWYPSEYQNFRHHSTVMRRVFGRWHRAIPLLHRNGNLYKITPRNGRMRKVPAEQMPKFGVYKVVHQLPFPDEIQSDQNK